MRRVVATLVLLVTLLVLVTVARTKIPEEAVEAHKYADTVLMPRFVAEWNDWIQRHPKDRPGHPWEHCERLDAGDVERWGKVRQAFRDLDRAYKRAGY